MCTTKIVVRRFVHGFFGLRRFVGCRSGRGIKRMPGHNSFAYSYPYLSLYSELHIPEVISIFDKIYEEL
jgi:hypothetical protein